MSIEFTNLNQCFSVTQAFGSVGATQLSASGLFYYLKAGESTTIRGITNSAQISAVCTSSSGNLTYRTQFFSFNPLNTY